MIESRSPVTGALIGVSPVDTAADVAAALDAGRIGQGTWGALPVSERVRHLRSVRRRMAANAARIADTAAAETGKTPVDARLEVVAALSMLDWVCKHAEGALRPRKVRTAPVITKSARVQYEPYGVVGVIAPWNYPIAIPFQSIPWILACGNTVLFKPSELSSLTGRILADTVNSAGRELVHVVTGYGETGAALVGSGVEKVVFTGSGATGRRIATAAAQQLIPVVMELGGKDACIICDDADLERAARCLVGAAFHNSGQTCVAPERAIVMSSVYERFLTLLRAELARLRIGSGPGDHVGALTQFSRKEVLQRRVDDALAEGARLVARAEVPGPAWFPPTILADVPHHCELWREESFGPVLSVTKVDRVDEAIRVANDNPLGLTCSAFSRSRSTLEKLAGSIVCGGVSFNDVTATSGIAALPFGGEKGSGYGRLQGSRGFDEFSRSKSIAFDRFPSAPALAGLLMTGKRPSPKALDRLAAWAYGRGAH